MTDKVEDAGKLLADCRASLASRCRALFLLKSFGGDKAVKYISSCFQDPSALLKHELAFCLGQMRNENAIPVLTSVLEDTSQEAIVRHEAGEALGAIGNEASLKYLEKYKNDPLPVVADTCTLAIERIRWLKSNPEETNLHLSPYDTVDPAPPYPSNETNIGVLKSTLINQNRTLFDRYRAMFSLRDLGTEESAAALAEGLKCSGSALFRHEIAYVLGQMQPPSVVPQLTESLKDLDENSMVRHECAEALGLIADETCLGTLNDHLNDRDAVVKESCEVVLDMYEYERSSQFQ